jgi:hypothetical protein
MYLSDYFLTICGRSHCSQCSNYISNISAIDWQDSSKLYARENLHPSFSPAHSELPLSLSFSLSQFQLVGIFSSCFHHETNLILFHCNFFRPWYYSNTQQNFDDTGTLHYCTINTYITKLHYITLLHQNSIQWNSDDPSPF